MAITNGYCTLDEFKAYAIPNGGTNAGDDVVIENIIEGASRQIDGKCGRFFYQSTTTKYYTADATGYIKTDDIYTSTGLELYSDLDGDGVYEDTWIASNYYLTPYNPEAGFPFSGIERTPTALHFFSRAPKGNKVVASFGWAAVPDDIRQACLIVSLHEYHRRFGENTSAVATITGAGVVITPQGFPLAAYELIKRYRRIT